MILHNHLSAVVCFTHKWLILTLCTNMFHRGRSSAICVTIQCTVITLLMVRYCPTKSRGTHYFDVIMGAMASQITSLTVVHSNVHSGADQRKHQSSASLAFMRGIHRRPVNSPHKWPVTRKMIPFDEVIMKIGMGHSKSSSNFLFSFVRAYSF